MHPYMHIFNDSFISSYIVVCIDKLLKLFHIYLPRSISNGSEMLNIQFYCKNIKYITAFANQIYQFTVHGHARYNLRVTVDRKAYQLNDEMQIDKRTPVAS
jgi:hypothetical protein